MKKNKLSPEEQLLRDKIEKVGFDYEASDWQSLEQKLPAKKGLQFTKWLVASTAVVIISSVAYFLSSETPSHKPNERKAGQAIVSTKTAETEVEAEKANPKLEGKQETNKITREKTTKKKEVKDDQALQINPPLNRDDLQNNLTVLKEGKLDEQPINELKEQTEKNDSKAEMNTLDFSAIKASVHFKLSGKACSGENIELTAKGKSIEPQNLIWEYGNTTFRGEKINISLKKEDPALVSLFFQTDNNAKVKLKDTLIYPKTLPQSDFTYTEHNGILTDFQLTLVAKETEVTNTYKWTLNNKTISNESSFTYNFKKAGNYTVTLEVSAQNGCKSSNTRNIQVKDDHSIFINAFTPNGDGYQDSFMPQGFENFEGNFSFKVYNLQNNLLYETNNPLEGWNGRIKNTGEMQSTGLYVWEIKVSDNKGKYRAFSDKVSIRK